MTKSCSASTKVTWRPEGGVPAPEFRPCRNPVTTFSGGKFWCSRHAPGPEERSDFELAVEQAEAILATRYSYPRLKLLASEFLKAVRDERA